MDITQLAADMSKRAHIDDNSNVGQKREGVLDWDDYFMATAFLAAMRSKDPNLQVGACIVNKDKRIVATGYNGMARGCSDDVFPWRKNAPEPLNEKKMYVCHAEMNAILNKNMADLNGCTIYQGLAPCNECAKMIIQSGISKVIYYSDEKKHKPSYQASKKMFDAAGVIYEQFVPKNKKIVIEFKQDDTQIL